MDDHFQLIINRRGIQIVPLTDLAKAYLEDTLGLTRHGQQVPFVRRESRASEQDRFDIGDFEE